MLKDKRDNFEDNEDIDLTGMIHQYNEDNELRRKINELKKQKANAQEETTCNTEDSALMGNTFTSLKDDDDRIPNIRADQDVEKTRVGFNDESDKTLVIMDRKNKVDANTKPEDLYDDYSYVDQQNATTAFRETNSDIEATNLDLASEIKEKKSKKAAEVEGEDDRTRKINKTIMIVIISIISIALLVGIGFGVKYAFFDKDTTEDTTPDKKTSTKKKPTSTTKDKDKDTDENKTDIDDNSAIITQLKQQLKTYEDQYADVNTKLGNALAQVNTYQGKLNAIPILKQNLTTAGTTLTTAETAVKTTKTAKETACKLDDTSEECLSATQKATDAEAAYEKAKVDRDSSQVAYDTEYNKTADYQSRLKTAQENYNSLDKQKTDLEVKIADTNTKLAKYN